MCAVQVAQKTPPHLRQWCLRSRMVNGARHVKVSQRFPCESGFQKARGISTAKCSFLRIGIWAKREATEERAALVSPSESSEGSEPDEPEVESPGRCDQMGDLGGQRPITH